MVIKMKQFSMLGMTSTLHGFSFFAAPIAHNSLHRIAMLLEEAKRKSLLPLRWLTRFFNMGAWVCWRGFGPFVWLLDYPATDLKADFDHDGDEAINIVGATHIRPDADFHEGYGKDAHCYEWRGREYSDYRLQQFSAHPISCWSGNKLHSIFTL